jgi:uncharacterized protein YdbL (DUF1318 family)
LASGGRPVYILRDDHSNEFQELFEKLNVPVVESLDAKKLAEAVSAARAAKYKTISQESNKIAHFIKDCLNL